MLFAHYPDQDLRFRSELKTLTSKIKALHSNHWLHIQTFELCIQQK